MNIKNKIMLKNREKFTNIKLATGIDLKSFTFKINKNSIGGISLNRYKNVTFLLKKGTAFFKTYTSDMYYELKNNRIINECICYELAKQMGLNCAEYEPAHNNDDVGLVSYKINGDKEEIISAFQLLKKDYVTLKDVNYYFENNPKYKNFDKEQIILDLYKIMVFDLITLQCDRHSDNVHFVYNKKDKTLKVSPVMDNEMAFAISFIDTLVECGKVATDVSWDDIEGSLKYFPRIKVDINLEEGINFNNEIKDMVFFAKINKKLKDILISALKNINVENAIENVNKKGFEIDDCYKNYMIKIVNLTKYLIKEEIKKQFDKNNQQNKSKIEDIENTL